MQRSYMKNRRRVKEEDDDEFPESPIDIIDNNNNHLTKNGNDNVDSAETTKNKNSKPSRSHTKTNLNEKPKSGKKISRSNSIGSKPITNKNRPDLIITKLNGKSYFHLPNLDIEATCLHLPVKDNRKNLGVTVLENFIFYHDQGLYLESTDVKIKELITTLQNLNNEPTESVKREYILNIIYDYELDLSNFREIKASSIKWYGNRYLKYTPAEEGACRPASAKKNRDIGHDDRFTDAKSTTSKKTEDWEIDGWLRSQTKNKIRHSLTSPDITPDHTKSFNERKFADLKLESDDQGSENKLSENLSEIKATKKTPMKDSNIYKSIFASVGLFKRTEPRMTKIEEKKDNQQNEKKENHTDIETNHTDASFSTIIKPKPSKVEEKPRRRRLSCDKQLMNKTLDDSTSKNPRNLNKGTPMLDVFMNRCRINNENSGNDISSALDLSVSEPQFRKFQQGKVDCCDFTPSTRSGRSFHIKDDLKRFFEKKSLKWRNCNKNLVDTHCHFEMLFSKIRYKKTVEDYFKECGSIYIDNFEACVNVICDPNKFNSMAKLTEQLRICKHPKVYSTIGCHPHFSDFWTNSIERLIYNVLFRSDIVAIGECGLDSSRKNHVEMSIQEEAFKAQLQMAYETKKPIVIHCRDMEKEVYEIMAEYLETDHRIHLHCFTGGWKIGQKYLNHFENLCIGATPLVTYRGNKEVRELIENIPLDRLLLETDAPYFVPQTFEFPSGVESSHPAFIYATVETVASMREVTINELLDYNRANVKKVYGF